MSRSGGKSTACPGWRAPWARAAACPSRATRAPSIPQGPMSASTRSGRRVSASGNTTSPRRSSGDATRIWDRGHPEDVAHTLGNVRILVVQGRATMLSSLDPAWIDEAIEEWREARGRPRDFTRKIISQYIALNRYSGETAELLLRGVLWLIVTNDDALEVVDLMRRREVEVRYNIAYLDDQPEMRFRLSCRNMH